MVGATPVDLLPDIYNGEMDNGKKLNESSEITYEVGSRIKCGENFGTIKYIGEVRGYKGTWYGVEWDDPGRGKHNGVVDGVEYFKTSKDCAGSFVKSNKILQSQTCADAIRKYYGGQEDDETAAQRQAIIDEWKREMKASFIEMVGFEKIRQKQVKFSNLSEVCVHDQCVAKAGNVADLCPNLKSLDLSQNLFSNWREVITLTAQLPALSDLDLSKNRMAFDIPNNKIAHYQSTFENLCRLNLSICDYDWTDIMTIVRLMLNLEEIIVAHNRISVLTLPPEDTLRHLRVLKLDGNPLSSWDEIMKLGGLTNLTVLSLNDCQIDKIVFNDRPLNEKVDIFVNLQVLFVNRNNINNWRSISELDKLKSLVKLYFLKNPVLNPKDYDTDQQMIIAKIGGLQTLNGSVITNEMRRGAEYDYIKCFGLEWKRTRSVPGERDAFDREHCRFNDLLQKHGVPDDNLLQNKPKRTTLLSKLIEITFKDEITGSTQMKKLPSTMLVQNLATLAQRLFPTGGKKNPKLYCLDSQRGDIEIELDNFLKDLNYFSVRNGDVILVRWS